MRSEQSLNGKLAPVWSFEKSCHSYLFAKLVCCHQIHHFTLLLQMKCMTSDIYLHNYSFLSTKAKNKVPVYQLTHIATGAKILNQK